MMHPSPCSIYNSIVIIHLHRLINPQIDCDVDDQRPNWAIWVRNNHPFLLIACPTLLFIARDRLFSPARTALGGQNVQRIVCRTMPRRRRRRRRKTRTQTFDTHFDHQVDSTPTGEKTRFIDDQLSSGSVSRFLEYPYS